MTSSEDQQGRLSSSDEQTVVRAKESLTTLLRKDNCTAEEISTALEYLTELKNRIADIGERRPALLSEYQRYSGASETAKSRQERLDHDIIDTKLRASELLSEKDSIARDLARAKRALNEADEPLDTPVSGSTNDANGSATSHFGARETGRTGNQENGGSSSNDEFEGQDDLRDEHDIEALERSLASEMEGLRIAEEELINVVDQINSAVKKRAELQEKLKVAQEEW